MGKRVAVVILNWNGERILRRYLPSVIDNSGDEAEIIVADNASADGSLETLSSEFPSVRVIPMTENRGFAGGYNEAFAILDRENAAAGLESPQYYLLLNSDVRVEADWLAPMLRYMDEHADVAAAAPKLLSDTDPTLFEYAGAAGGYVDKYGYPYCRGRVLGNVETDCGQYDTPTDTLWATGACLMIRRADYWAVGGMDARFFAHNEEIDLCWRLRLAGRRVVCVPQSAAYHLGGGTLPKGNPRKTYLNFRNNLTMLYKNLPDAELRRVLRMRAVLDWVAALQTLILGRSWGDFKAIVKARRDFRKWRGDFDSDRRWAEEQRKRNPEAGATPFGVTSISILKGYYLLGRRTFAGLHKGD